jgi:hypothetical protein
MTTTTTTTTHATIPAFIPPHDTLTQRAFLADFGTSLTGVVAEGCPPVYRGPQDTPWAPLSYLLRRPLGAQGFIAQAGAAAIRGQRPHQGQPGRKRRRGLGLVCEMATGKTFISLSVLALADEQVNGERASDAQRPEKASFFPAIVLSPAIVVNKWVREARKTIPHVQAVALRAIKTEEDARAFREFDPSFPIKGRLSALGCAERIVARIRRDLAAWKQACAEARRHKRPLPRKPAHLVVLSTSTAKLGSAWKPVYRLGYLRERNPETQRVHLVLDPDTLEPVRVPCCPRCFAPLLRQTVKSKSRRGEREEEAVEYLTEEELLGQGEQRARRQCTACGEHLWQMVPQANVTLQPLGDQPPAPVKPLPLPDRDFHPPCVKSTLDRRYPIADYLRRHHRGLFRTLIADEAHQFKGAGTAQGFAAASLLDATNPGGTGLFLTGTLFSGFASDLFPMLWRLLPELRQEFGYGDLKRWVDRYGVRQRVTKTYESQRTDGAVSKRRSDRPQVKELPGISPLVLPRHLLDACLFLELADVAPGLPPYREEVRTIPLGPVLGPVYHHLEQTATAALHQLLAQYDTYALASWFTGLMVQPNLPWYGVTIAHPRTGYVLGEAPPLPEELVYPKEHALLELLRQERSEGRRCLVYVEHTGEYDLLTRLERLIKEDDARWRAGLPVQENEEETRPQLPLVVPRPAQQPNVQVRVLRSRTVQSTERETWLEQTVEAGCDVLLCHSGLVEVGLDLLAFPTIVCYEAIFSTTRLRQATRRSYRPGQTLPVQVYQLVYQKSMEARGLLLIAQKIASSLMVEGKLPGGESLATQALGSQGTNPLLDLARSVLQDAEGQHREVAGSLEAAFAAMQEAECAQDAYVGGDALQEALDTTLLASGCRLSEAESDLEEGDGLAAPLLAPAPGSEPVQPDVAETSRPLFSPDVLTPPTTEDTEEESLLPLPPVMPTAAGRARPSTGGRKQRQPTPAPFLSLWDTLEPEEGTEPEQQDAAEEANTGVPPNTLVVLEAAEEREDALHPAGEAAEALTAASPPFTPAAALVVKEGAADTETARAASPVDLPPSVPASTEEDVEEQLVAALQYLAGACDGARALDGQGFNKVDARFGHDLAVQSLRRSLSPSQLRAAFKLLVKYQGQLQEVGLTLPTAEQVQQWLTATTERKPGGTGTITLNGHHLRVCFPTFNPEKVRQIKSLYARFGGRGFDGATHSWVLSASAAQAVLKAFPELLGAAEVEAALQAALAPVEELPALDVLLEQVRRCYHLVHGYAPNEQAMRQHIQTPAEAERWLTELQRRLTDQGPTTLA